LASTLRALLEIFPKADIEGDHVESVRHDKVVLSANIQVAEVMGEQLLFAS
jgi:hypothetical protein